MMGSVNQFQPVSLRSLCRLWALQMFAPGVLEVLRVIKRHCYCDSQESSVF